MNIDASVFVKDLQAANVDRAQIAETLPDLSFADLHAVFIQAVATVEAAEDSADHAWLQPVCEAVSQRIVHIGDSTADAIANDLPSDATLIPLAEAIARLYTALGPHHVPRYQLLTCLAQMGSRMTGEAVPEKCLGLLVDRMVNDPPAGIGPAAAPLVHLCRQQSPTAIQTLFPKLLDALANPDVAPAVLDLANFFARTGQTANHAASSRVDGLLRLAEAVVAELEPLQQATESPQDLRERQQQVARSLPLAISLCDAMGFIGDDRAIPTLTRIGELQHRRLRVEAAAARVRLAQRKNDSLGQEDDAEAISATEDLLGLAAEPSVRMRVLAYADELDLANQVPEEFDAPAARAEGELVAFLAQPTQMGLPPAECELVDSRTLYWPSYEEPRNCYLFRFGYQVMNNADKNITDNIGAPEALGEPVMYTNMAIAGPMIHAFHSDLTDLPTDDVYAAFAGWQAEHDDIRHQEIDPSAELRLLPDAVQELVRRIPDDFSSVQPRIFGLLFEQPVIIATAQRGTAIGSVVIDDAMHEPKWYPMINERSVGPGEAWLIYKGQRLLSSFNDEWMLE